MVIFNSTTNVLQAPAGFYAGRLYSFNYSGFTVVLQKRTPFPTIQHVCLSVLKLLHFQLAVAFVVTGLLN